MHHYQVFYNAITKPAWVIVDTTRRNSWGNYCFEGTFATQAEAETVALAWNTASARYCLNPEDGSCCV
jgi:hypothetical protein